jgi:hypothetical protein
MENKDTTIRLIIGSILIIVLTIIALDKPDNVATLTSTSKINEDSLHNVIDSLQTEIFYLEDGFDEKEHRYEDVISEYEIGLSYLKDYHPTAYKDFHRIIGMKEQYTHQLDRENKKRLKSHEQYR